MNNKASMSPVTLSKSKTVDALYNYCNIDTEEETFFQEYISTVFPKLAIALGKVSNSYQPGLSVTLWFSGLN